MRSKAELRREIEKATSLYSPQDLFSSPYFRDNLQATVTAVCEKLGRIPFVETICDKGNSLTACTNGSHILINTQTDLVADSNTNWKQYIGNIGLVVHESGHVLFTDFAHQNPMREAWAHSDPFRFYPKQPSLPETKELMENLNKFPKFREVYADFLCYVVNTIEDAYIENRLRQNFDGLAVAGLAFLNRKLYERCPSVEVMLHSCLTGELTPMSLVSNWLLIHYKVGKEVPMGNLDPVSTKLWDEIKGVLDSCEEYIKELCFEQDGMKRCELYNRLFVRMAKIFPPPEELSKEENSEGDSGEENGAQTEGTDAQAEKQNSSGSGSSRDLTEEEAKKLSESMKKAEAHTGSPKAPFGITSGIQQKAKSDEEESDSEKRKHAEALSDSEESGLRGLQEAIKEAVQSAVLDENEKEHVGELGNEARDLFMSQKHEVGHAFFKQYNVHRVTVGESDRMEYGKIYREVQRSAKNLVRKISSILKERECDSVESGFLMGQRFNAQDLVHRDGKYFSRQVIPDEKAKVVFGILVDESGSMWSHEKWIKARKATILLEDALRNLGIPCEIIGHTEDYGACELNVYADFDTMDGKDRYRLSHISAISGNIDGAAITFLGEKLLKRPETVKVMIVISDGLPAGSSFYSGKDMDEDTKLAVEHYRKKHIRVFGAIVDDYDKVAEIYGKDYAFDCRDSGKLEADLTKLVKRYVLARE